MRILIYRLGSLGDMLVSLPAMRVVRAAYPQAKVTLLTNIPVSGKAAPAALVLDQMGLIDDYLAYPVGTGHPIVIAGLLWLLRRRGFDLVVNLAAWRGARSLLRDRWFFRLGVAGSQVGFTLAESGPLRIFDTGVSEAEADRLLRRVAALGRADAQDRRWYEVRLSEEEKAAARATLAKGGVRGPFLAVSMGTKVSAKDWGVENWKSLTAKLSQDWLDLGLVLVGSADERERAEICSEPWRGSKFNLCGLCSPRESAAILAMAQVYVGHDSGPMHLAAAVGTPCVAIFAARSPRGQWFPLGQGHTVLYRTTDCMGCGLDLCETQGKKCILTISVPEVAEAIWKYIRCDM